MMWGLTASSLATVLMSPLAGSLMDKRSARVLFSIGAACLALGMALISVSRNVWEFILVYGLVMSIGATLLGPIGPNTLVARWFSKKRGRALGITAIGTSLGGLLVPLLLQTLIDARGWRTACLWLGGIALVLLLPVILLIVRNRPADMGLFPDGEPDQSRGSGLHAGSAGLSPPNLMSDATFWRITLTVGVLMAVFTVILANLVPFAIGAGVPAGRAAILISVISAAGICGKLIFSVFADRVDLKWAMLVALVMLGWPLAVLCWFNAYPVMVVAAASIGLASGAFLPAWSALVARIYGPSFFGRVMGRMQPVAIVMVMLAMPVSGHLFDRTGSYAATFLTMATAAVLAIAILLPVKVGNRPA
jgi:MFS family permease